MDNAKGSRGNALFEQLAKLVRLTMPDDFVDEGVGQMAGAKVYSLPAPESFLWEFEKSSITGTVSVSVRKRKPTERYFGFCFTPCKSVNADLCAE